MFGLTPFGLLFVVWGAVSAILVLLLIYRSLIGMKEDDMLFLDPAEAMLEAEQKEVTRRLHSVGPYVRGFGLASGGLLCAMATIFTVQVVRALM